MEDGGIDMDALHNDLNRLIMAAARKNPRFQLSDY
jgi:hypothetical protein